MTMKLSNGVKVFLVTMVSILAIADYQMFVGLKGENFLIED